MMKMIEYIKDKYDDLCYYFNEIKKEPKEIYRKPKRIIKSYYHRLIMSFKWFRRSWNMYDWDSDYLIEIMVYKMKDMLYQLDVVDSWFVDLRHQPTGEYEDIDCSDSECEKIEKTRDLLKSLERAIELGEKLLKHDYILYTPEIQEWFDTHDIFNDKMSDEMHKELMNIYNQADIDEANDRNEFFNTIRDNHQFWWS